MFLLSLTGVYFADVVPWLEYVPFAIGLMAIEPLCGGIRTKSEVSGRWAVVLSFLLILVSVVAPACAQLLIKGV